MYTLTMTGESTFTFYFWKSILRPEKSLSALNYVDFTHYKLKVGKYKMQDAHLDLHFRSTNNFAA